MTLIPITWELNSNSRRQIANKQMVNTLKENEAGKRVRKERTFLERALCIFKSDINVFNLLLAVLDLHLLLRTGFSSCEGSGYVRWGVWASHCRGVSCGLQALEDA